MKVKSTVIPAVAFSNLVTSLVLPSLEMDTKVDVGRRQPRRECWRGRVMYMDYQKHHRPPPPPPPPHSPYLPHDDPPEEDGEFSDSDFTDEEDFDDNVDDNVDGYVAETDNEANVHVLGAKGISPLFVNGAGAALIPHRYIIVFKEGVLPEEIDFHMENVATAHMQSIMGLAEYHPFFRSTKEGVFRITAVSPEGGIQHRFEISDKFKGYVGYFTDELVKLIRWNPLVQFVEQDSVVEATEFDTQNGATWGLARISHRERLNLGSFNKYLYDDEAGEGVTSYVVDTGINIDHVDFEGRAVWGKTIPTNDADYDGNGHGTHCAGTIASKTYGVAKKAEVVAVKVLRSNGTGSMSDVLKGVEYVAQAHKKAVKENKKGFKGSTANMSLGGGRSPALDLAVDAAVSAGVHFAVAAGNENQNACNTSPAGSKKAITVGASTLADERAYFSNWGKCVDVFAPGLNILSTYIGSDSAVATLSGTSMASPHVAGLLSYFLSLQPGNDSDYGTGKPISPDVLKSKLLAYSSPDVLGSLPPQTPNKLIYNGGGRDLSDFWGKNPSDLATGAQQGAALQADMDYGTEREADGGVPPGVRNLLDRVESGTDYVFSELRHLLDGMNII